MKAWGIELVTVVLAIHLALWSRDDHEEMFALI
jgi:hypothetical protein